MTIEHIPCKAIRPDPKWKYHLDGEDSILTKSLKLTGVLSPLVLLQNTDEYLVLDGFRRYRFLRDQSVREIPAFLYSMHHAQDGLLHSLVLNETNSALTTIEKSNVVRIIQSFNDDEGFQNKVYNFLNIPPKRQFIRRYLTISAFPDSAKHYFHEFQFSMRQIERIMPVSIQSLVNWIELAQELHIKAQEFVRLVETIWDISIRDDIPVDHLYDRFKICDLLRQNATAQQKSANLKDILNQKRYPILNSIERRMTLQFDRIRMNSPLPMKVSWDKTLEQSGYWLEIYLEHYDSVDQLQSFFESPEWRNDLKKPFKLMMHSPEDSNETT
jgi:hypothetical protein